MSIYAIGDLQGCFFSLQSLLKTIDFNSRDDELWFVGDLVNRGKGSLEVLNWCYNHRDKIKIVLGNHDLHFLAIVSFFEIDLNFNATAKKCKS
jgi:bis(5'-nucleosyl)-tetraphosphatase (symmetrical)